MKKFLFFSVTCLALLTTSVVSRAQTPAAFSQTATNPTGAITNTSIDTMTYTLSKSYQVVSIQPKVTKATGTMAGWAVLDYSVNGTDYKIGTDTLSLTNVTTNTTVWDKVTAARYFRIRVGGATTVTGTAAAKIGGTD
jgi:hypothetical protein